jgi:hypothetical protein
MQQQIPLLKYLLLPELGSNSRCLAKKKKIIFFGSNPWSTTLRGEYANLFTTGSTELVLEIYLDHIQMGGPGRKSN